MTQEEFDKAPLLDQILYDTTGMLAENHPSIAEAMDKYHQAKLKLLGIADAVLPCQVYYPADKRNVELKEIKGDKAIIRLKFAGYWHNYDKEVLLSELMPIAEHKHDVDSFNGHCQVCGKYCR